MMLKNVQAMRGFAAIMVMLFHFGLMPVTKLPFTIGAFGVDLFFVLSGFIIAHSSMRSPRHFLPHRLIRVLPPYWIATLIAALFTLKGMTAGATAGWFAQSIAFLPGPSGRPDLIFVAWTLVYELGFYLLYWLALRFGTTLAPVVAMTLLLVLAVAPIRWAVGPWPLLMEFALGIWVYLVTERSRMLSEVPGAWGLAISGAGALLLVLLPWLFSYSSDDYNGAGRVLCWGVPAAAVLLGLVVAERCGLAVRRRLVLLLGSASYAIYLLHPIVLGQLLQLPPQPQPLSWLYCLAAAMLTIALATGFYLLVEAPLLRWMRGLLRDRPRLVEEATPTPTSTRAGR